MALEIMFEDQFGNTYKDAYARIGKRVHTSNPNGTKSTYIEVDIYKNKAARDASKTPLPSSPQSYGIAMDADKGTTADAYVALKAQAGAPFTGAADV